MALCRPPPSHRLGAQVPRCASFHAISCNPFMQPLLLFLPSPAPQAHLAYNQLPTENAALLDELVAARHEMAGLMGFPSFAHYKVGAGGCTQSWL